MLSEQTNSNLKFLIFIENKNKKKYTCSQLDSRLTKVPPARATITVIPVKEPGDVDEPALRRTMLKNISAGKAMPYTKVELKIYNECQVKVYTSNRLVSVGK